MKRNWGFLQRRIAPLTVGIALLALAACGSRSDYRENTSYDTEPDPTTTYVSADTVKVRAWWDSLTDLEKLSACDTYGSYVLGPDGSDQAFVDWVLTQGANEVQAWTLAGVLGENCVGRM